MGADPFTTSVLDQQLSAQRQQVADLQERTSMARVIDDALAESLAALCIHLQSIRSVLERHDVDRSLALLEQAHRMAAHGLTDSRHASQTLRDGVSSLDDQISTLIELHRGTWHGDIDFKIGGNPRPLGHAATLALFRTTQQAVANAAMHAQSQPVWVRLIYDSRRTIVSIINQLAQPISDALLPPGHIQNVQGSGLTIAHERLLLIDGSLRCESDRHFWTVTAQVPQ